MGHVDCSDLKTEVPATSEVKVVKTDAKKSNSDLKQASIKRLGVTPISGACFQVMTKSHNLQSYRIYMHDLKQAALIADRCAIQRYGLRAKTNFDYS